MANGSRLKRVGSARKRDAEWRRLLFLGVIFVLSVVYALKLLDIQVFSRDTLLAAAAEKRAVETTIPSVRGDIVDRNGVVLATTDERYDVQISPKNTRVNNGQFWRTAPDGRGTVVVKSSEAFAEIAKVTGQTADEIEEIVDEALKQNPNSDFAYVKKSINLVQLNALKKLEIPWLTFTQHNDRTYPSGAVAGQIVGFVGDEGEPLAGIEYSQNQCLQGTDGLETYERGADQVPLPGSTVVEKQVKNGGTVTLTIDRDLQWEAQQNINEQVQKVGAEWGYLVIMNAKTGELLAVAEDGSVDPNNIDAVDASHRESRAFTAPYEPGSTFKTLTTSALINEGAATPNTQLLTPNFYSDGQYVRVNDSTQHPEMRWTLTGIIVNSSNVGTSTLGVQLPAATRYEYMKKFGIGTPTHAGMPVEDGGLLRSYKEWDPQTNYNTNFGQGVSTTIIQTAGIYQTIANGGVRVPPTIVKSCTSADGKVTTPKKQKSVRVVSKETASQVKDILETVVAKSWVNQFVPIPGYRFAGKTGTAEEVDPATGLYRNSFVHSFAGFFPSEDPQYVIATSIAFPANSIAGGVAAVQAWNTAAQTVIRTYHLPPTTTTFTPLPDTY